MLKNLLANWSALIFQVAAVLITYPLLIQRLGPESYGLWLLITSIASYAAMLQLGVPIANVRFLARALGSGDVPRAAGYLSSNLAFFLLIAVLVTIVGALVSHNLEHLSDRLESVPVAVKLACFVAFLEVAIRFVFECFEGLIHAQKAFVPLAMLRNLCSVLRVVLIYFLLLDGASILMLSIIICLLTLAQSAAMAMIALRQKPFVRPRLSLIDLAKIKETFSFSSFVMLTQLAGRFAAATAPVIVGTKLGLAAVVPFSAAASLINYLSSIIVNVSRTLLPYVSTEEYSEDLAKMSRVYTDVSRLSSGIILPAIAGLLVMGEYLLGQWLGDEVGKDTFGVLSVLVVGQALHLVQRGSAYPSLTARGDVSGVALVYVISALVGTGLAFGGAEPYGLRGVALGVAAGSFLSGAGLMTLAFYRFRPHWFGYLVDGYGRGICLAVIVFAVGRLAQQLFVEHPNMNLVLQLLLCGSAALLGIYGVILKPAERGVVNAFLNSNLKKRVS